MALIHRPGETIPFSPADQDAVPAAKRITYYLRVPSVYDKIAYRRALGERGAQLHPPAAMLRTLRRGVEHIMADSPAKARDQHLAAIDAQIERQDDFTTRLLAREFDTDTDDGRKAFAEAMRDVGLSAEALVELEALVRQGYGPYRAMAGDNAVYWAIAGLEAARIFLDGCDGLPGFSRGRQGTDEAFLVRIPDGHLFALAQRVQELMSPSEDDAKNSGSPSGSSSEAAISKASKTRPPKTRSKTTPGT